MRRREGEADGMARRRRAGQGVERSEFKLQLREKGASAQTGWSDVFGLMYLV